MMLFSSLSLNAATLLLALNATTSPDFVARDYFETHKEIQIIALASFQHTHNAQPDVDANQAILSLKEKNSRHEGTEFTDADYAEIASTFETLFTSENPQNADYVKYPQLVPINIDDVRQVGKDAVVNVLIAQQLCNVKLREDHTVWKIMDVNCHNDKPNLHTRF